MGVHTRRFAVCCPAGMSDADVAGAILIGTKGFQIAHLAFGFVDAQRAFIVNQGASGTVVPSVFQTLKAFYQDRIGIPLPYITNYSAHIMSSIKIPLKE